MARPTQINKFFKMLQKILIIFLLISSTAHASQSRTLTIFAEPNVALPLTKIARQFSRVSNVIVSINFTSADNLIYNIDNGEPADIFISAHNTSIETLHQKGVIDIYNVGYVAQDQLVVATPKENDLIPQLLKNENISFNDALKVLNNEKAAIILDEDGNSSGFFAKAILAKSALNDVRVFSRIAEDRTSLLSAIKSNKNNYSILLASQIYNKADFKILAKNSDISIFYQALIIAGDNMEVAREFLKFMKSDEAKIYFKSYGFIVN